MSNKPVFTTFEAARLCHVSPLSIINWVNAGRLAAFRTPGGHRRIRREDLILFMRDNGLPIPDELREGSGRTRVLIVDGDTEARGTLAEHLTARSPGYEVKTAADAFEAGRLVATFRPDLVVLDLRLPGMDGFQVCRAIKAAPETSGTHVISTTGYLTPETEARSRECGALRCFAKPLDLTTVSAFIDSSVSQRAPSRPKRGRSGRD